MPSIHTVERFVSMVEAGQGVEALVQFYAEHASMQENGAEPRVGKAALLAHERAAQASAVDLRSSCIRPILIAGNVSSSPQTCRSRRRPRRRRYDRNVAETVSSGPCRDRPDHRVA